MQNFQDIFESRKRSFISTFPIYMTVPLKNRLLFCESYFYFFLLYSFTFFRFSVTGVNNYTRPLSVEYSR